LLKYFFAGLQKAEDVYASFLGHYRFIYVSFLLWLSSNNQSETKTTKWGSFL